MIWLAVFFALMAILGALTWWLEREHTRREVERAIEQILHHESDTAPME